MNVITISTSQYNSTIVLSLAKNTSIKTRLGPPKLPSSWVGALDPPAGRYWGGGGDNPAATEQKVSLHGLWTATGRLEAKLDRLLARTYREPANRRLAKHLRHERPSV